MDFKTKPKGSGCLIFETGVLSKIIFIPKGGPGSDTIKPPRGHARSEPREGPTGDP